MFKGNILRVFKTILLVIALAFTIKAAAFTYNTTDLLLVFRKDGLNDVVFNLGNVSNFLALADGTTITVTNWDANAAKTNYANSFSGTKWIMMASTAPGLVATQRRTWLTCADSSAIPTDIAGQTQGNQSSKIRYVGDNAAKDLANTTNVMVVASTSDASYTFACGSGGQDLPTLGGTAAFTVEQDVPGTNRFFEMKVNSSFPNARQPGVFVLNSLGILTFTAGTGSVAAIPPQILQHPLSQTVKKGTNVSFSVVATGTPPLTYQWRYWGTNLTGQTATNLVLTNVTPSVAGNYTVVVNGSGSITSSIAQLRVLEAPTTVSQTLSRNGSKFSFSILSQSNLNYTLEFISTLGNAWSNASVTVPGTGGSLNLQDTSATNDNRFYRIRVE